MIMFQIIFIIVSAVAASASTSPRNVLLIISDDLRYLDENAVTPNIDGLAKISLNFKHAYAQVMYIIFHIGLITV